MAKSRQLKGRIRSVQNTRKITKTMELVATSKLKRAQDRVVGARPYAEALRQVIADLFTPDLADRFPLLRQPVPPGKGGPRRAAVILLTSNRGLAGGFNSNLIKEARRRIESLEQQGYTVDLFGVGKKGIGLQPVSSRAWTWFRRDSSVHCRRLRRPSRFCRWKLQVGRGCRQ
jgi:F-type H+-transporting ATPase subunit gamma